MDLTIKHEKTSSFAPQTCDKCEQNLNPLVDSWHVVLYFGNLGFRFDESCFKAILLGQIEFYKVFLLERAREKLEIMN